MNIIKKCLFHEHKSYAHKMLSLCCIQSELKKKQDKTSKQKKIQTEVIYIDECYCNNISSCFSHERKNLIKYDCH